MSRKDDLDPKQGVTRRKVLQTGAAVGGLVWAAPAVKTAGRLAAASGSPSPSSTTTTVVEDCDCTFCVVTEDPPNTFQYFICAPATTEECDCLCNCGGANTPCNQSDPCIVTIVCPPTPNNEPCTPPEENSAAVIAQYPEALVEALQAALEEVVPPLTGPVTVVSTSFGETTMLVND